MECLPKNPAKMDNDKPSELDRSPGATGKSTFAWERYNTDVRTLMKWIEQNPELKKELKKLRYKKRQKLFTPKQKEAIIKHIG